MLCMELSSIQRVKIVWYKFMSYTPKYLGLQGFSRGTVNLPINSILNWVLKLNIPRKKIYAKTFPSYLCVLVTRKKSDLTHSKKKKQKKNGHICKTRTNLESKPRYSKGSFKSLQSSLIFCALYLRGYTTWGLHPLQPLAL